MTSVVPKKVEEFQKIGRARTLKALDRKQYMLTEKYRTQFPAKRQRMPMNKNDQKASYRRLYCGTICSLVLSNNLENACLCN
jgi:hypothetical protein